MRYQQVTSINSITTRKFLKRLKYRLILAHQCLVEKDKIIRGLRLDLDHLMGQLPKIKQTADRAIN